jgi:uncharacterized protein DUF4838/glycosyl hydrolase family 2
MKHITGFKKQIKQKMLTGMSRYQVVYVCLLLTISTCVSALDIVKNRKETAVIVTPNHPYKCVQRAAWELRHHVKKATGATLQTVEESAIPVSAKNFIYLGACKASVKAGLSTDKLKRNGFKIKSYGNKLFMIGRDMKGDWKNRDWVESGTLSAVYDFLRKKMGVSWLWPGGLGEAVPKKSNIHIKNYNRTFNPPLLSSHFYPSYRRQEIGWSGKKAHEKFVNDEVIWERRHGFSWYGRLRFGHAFGDFWKRFGKTHEEYFNMLPDSTRRPDPFHICGGAGKYVSMCWSNPEFQRQVIKDWKKRRKPHDPNLRIGGNDADGSCCCPNCMKWDVLDPKLGIPWNKRLEYTKKDFASGQMNWTKKLGRVSDRYAKFCLAMQKLTQKENPDALIVGLGYANYTEPPLKTKLNKGVIIHFVGNIYYPWTEEKIKYFENLWAGWNKTGARLILRPNFMLDGHCMPIFTARKLGRLLNYCYSKGMVGAEFDSSTGQYGSKGPDLYVLARKQLMPDKPVQKILDEYYQAFGPAEEDVRKYFALWERISDTIPDHLIEQVGTRPIGKGRRTSNWNRFYTVADLVFTPEVMKKGRTILDAALAAAKNDPEARARVDFLYKGFKNAELTLAVQQAYKSKNKVKFAKTLKKLDAYRRSIEKDNVANMAYLALKENALWNRSLMKVANSLPGTPLLARWKFMWDPTLKGLNEKWNADKFDDSKWYNIGINSTWEQQPVGEKWKAEHKGRDYDGIAWYRNTFKVKPLPSGSKCYVRLTFGAVDEACTVWINGKKVLERPYPYKNNKDSWREPFVIDISKFIRFGQPNTLTVRVLDSAGAGGIWRPVWLKISKLTATNAQNQIENGNFEIKNKDWRRHVGRGSFKFSYDPKNAHSGKYSGLIECTKVNKKARNAYKMAFGRWYQTKVPVKPGQKYRFRVWVRTDKYFSGSVPIWVISGKQYSFNVPCTNGLWSEVEIKNIIPKNKTVDVYLNLLHKTGRVWFDDAELIAE